MTDKHIAEFAALIARHVRDTTIRSCDQLLSIKAKSPIPQRWKHLVENSHGNITALSVLSEVIPDVVDETIFSLFHAIDEQLLKLVFVADDGTPVDLPDRGMGELAGSWMMSEGWRADFSEERYRDDFNDLT